jgi:hypothetical protein
VTDRLGLAGGRRREPGVEREVLAPDQRSAYGTLEHQGRAHRRSTDAVLAGRDEHAPSVNTSETASGRGTFPVMSDDDWPGASVPPPPGTRLPYLSHAAFVDGEHPRGLSMRFSSDRGGRLGQMSSRVTPEQHVVLIRQYRPGIDKVCMEIPGGMVDDRRGAAGGGRARARRGDRYTAPTWRPLGVVSPNPAIQNNFLHSYLALGATKTRDLHPRWHEVVAVETRPLSEVTELLRCGAIRARAGRRGRSATSRLR